MYTLVQCFIKTPVYIQPAPYKLQVAVGDVGGGGGFKTVHDRSWHSRGGGGLRPVVDFFRLLMMMIIMITPNQPVERKLPRAMVGHGITIMYLYNLGANFNMQMYVVFLLPPMI